MSAAINAPVTLSMGSRFENIELAQYVCEYLLRRKRLTDATSHSISMALREALANAMKHGNAGDPAKRVTVRLELEDRLFRITVADEGGGFEPGRVADPLAPENRLKTSGRGIFYMRSFMDDVRYDFSHGGTRVVLEKRLTPAQEADAEEEKKG